MLKIVHVVHVENWLQWGPNPVVEMFVDSTSLCPVGSHLTGLWPGDRSRLGVC